MYSVISNLASIIEGLGVRFRYNSPVVSINVEGDHATGVTLADGERLTLAEYAARLFHRYRGQAH